MSELLGTDEATIARDRQGALLAAVARFNAVVALKGRETLIAAPGSRVYRNRAGNVGLATSGSGDTLAGLIAGLCARGAAPLQAAVWGVYLHARAGERLARKRGPLGYLARELPDEVPALLAQLKQK
jgi:ADP-dependent NAD(P)H-hydrate dehydratase